MSVECDHALDVNIVLRSQIVTLKGLYNVWMGEVARGNKVLVEDAQRDFVLCLNTLVEHAENNDVAITALNSNNFFH